MAGRDTATKPLEPAVYILASGINGTLYVGVTAAIYDRMIQHRNGTFGGFTKKYGATRLVYVEFHATMDAAIRREKQLKKWNRLWKIRLIEEQNPQWQDLWSPELGILHAGAGGQTPSRQQGGKPDQAALGAR